MTEAALAAPIDLPLVRLEGDVGSRPEGLERALTRAGFRVSEGSRREGSAQPDAILLTLGPVGQDTLADLLRQGESSPPRVVLFAGGDPELPTTALELGAADAMMSPVHLPELCARLHARIRDRQAPRRTAYERAAKDSLESLVTQSRTTLLPDEIVLALVRRLSRAFDLAACSFIVAESGEQGRVVAEVGAIRDPERLDLREYPEILEAIHTRRPATMAAPGHAQTVVLPVGGAQGEAVLLLRPHESGVPLAPAQLALATTLGEAALRALGTEGRSQDALALERRLDEEFERARRYSLTFSLVLVALDALEDAAGRLDEPAVGRMVTDVTAELRRTLRLPDFVCRYGSEGFAIVLPETDLAGARRSVGRIRERLAALPLETDAGAELSVGIASFPHPSIAQPDDMFALVEAALRRGKGRPGDRTGVAE